MPDITMCMANADQCSQAGRCYRSALSGTQPNPYRQSYFCEVPALAGDCKHFWENPYLAYHEEKRKRDANLNS